MKSRIVLAILSASLFGAPVFIARAANNVWTNGSGKWETGGNWSLGVPPSDTQFAILITNPVTKTVTIDATTAAGFPGSMTISNLTLSAPTSVTNTLSLGNPGTNTLLHILNELDVLPGGSLSITNAALLVDGPLDANGKVVLLDGTLTVTNGTLAVGPSFTPAELAVSNGVLLAGPINIGTIPNVEQSLTIAGGEVVAQGEVDLFRGGSLWVTGGSLLVTNNPLRIGLLNPCQMTVSNGVVLADSLFIGHGNNNVTMLNGQIGVQTDLHVGEFFGFATMRVLGGQLTVTNGTIFIGDGDGGQLILSNGTVSTANVSLFNNSSLTVSGGACTVSATLVVGDCAATPGNVTVAGGNLFVTNSAGNATLDVRSGTFSLNGGTLKVDRLIMTNSCGLFLRNGGTLLAGTVILDPSLDADGDGLPNGWEEDHGLDPLNGADGENTGTNSWIGANGKWEVGGDWSLNASPFLPQLGILITNSGNKTVTIDALTATNFPDTLFVRTLLLSAPTDSTNTLFVSNTGTNALHTLGTLTVGTGGNLALTNSPLLVDGFFEVDGSLITEHGNVTSTNGMTFIGFNGAADMSVSDGNFLARDVYVGEGADEQGNLTLAGGTSVFSSVLDIGDAGTGAVWFASGELVVTNGYIHVGVSGSGELTVSNGTLLANDVLVGGTDGTLQIAGGLTVLAASLEASQAGTISVSGGQLVVTNGGIIVAGTPAQMTVSGGAVLGANATIAQASLTLAGGTTTFNSNIGVVSSGGIWVSGGELVVTNTTIFLGFDNQGPGELTISNGTVLAGFMYLGVGTDHKDDELIIDGGNTVLSSGMTVDNGGSVWMSGGQLTATNGSATFGVFRDAQITISNGTFSATAVGLGQTAGSTGSMTFEGGVGVVFSNLVVGSCTFHSVGMLTIDNGGLFVINPQHTATLEVSDGQLVLNGGVLWVDNLILTNACGLFIRNGGILIADNIVLDPNLDADGDGIPNGWEQAHGLDPFNPNDANLDNDGDGMSNLQEYLAGTDPNDPNSNLRIMSITREGSDVRITWSMGSDRINDLEVDTGDVNGNYTGNFSNLFIVTNTVGSVTNYLDAGGATNTPARFYRVHVLSQLPP